MIASSLPGWDRLARALAGRTDSCRRGDAENRYVGAGWPSTEPAGAWAVHLADGQGLFRSLVLDLDAGQGDVAASVEAVCSLFRYVGVRHVVCASGPTGGAHVWATFTEGVRWPTARALMAALAGLAPALDASPMMNPVTGAVRPPLAAHRAGGRSELVDVDVAGAIAVLEEGNDAGVLAALGAELGVGERAMMGPRRAVSGRLWGLLRVGEGAARYQRPGGSGPDVSAMVMAVLLSAIDSGWGEEWALRQLEDRRNWLCRELDARRGRGAGRRYQRWLDRMVAGARAKHAACPPVAGPEEGRGLVEAVAEAVETSRWTGRAGLTDLAVLAGHVEIARRCGGVVHHGSARQVAEMAGVHRRTVAASWARLQAAGWLSVEVPASAVDATTWRLRVPLLEAAERHRLGAGPLGHDLFGWRADGKAAGRLYAALGEGPASVAVLAERTGLHPGTCRRSLRRLADSDVVTRADDGSWGLVAGHDLDDAVQGRPCAGAGVRRRIIHDLERRAWSCWRAVHPRSRPGGPAPPSGHRLAA